MEQFNNNNLKQKNTSIRILSRYLFTIDTANFINIYKTMLSNEIINVYLQLHSITNLNIKDGNEYFLNELLQKLSLKNTNEYDIAIKSLEALGLIQTYYNDSNNIKTHILYPPKEFSELIKNNIVKQLIINNVGQSAFDKLNYTYNCSNLVEINSINTSATIDYLVNSKKILMIDYNELLNSLNKVLGDNVIIPEDCKNIILTQCANFSINEIINLIISSITITDMNIKTIQKTLLQSKINNLLNTNLMFNRNIKIHRNGNLFFHNINNDELSKICDSYNLNCEQYLFSILKEELNSKQIEFMNNLRRKVEDKLINIAYDYSMQQIGKYNQNYIKKIIDSFLSKNISTIEEAIAYFQKINGSDEHNEKMVFEEWNNEQK